MSVFCALLLFVTLSSAATAKRTTSKAGAAKHVSSTKKTVKATSSHSSKKTLRALPVKSSSAKGKQTSKSTNKVVRGQQGIDSERTTEIQTALIREKYLDGEPSGVFDQATKEALMKFQRDNGWQTKVLPDSRALIKLGLGPSKDGLLNPESAAVSSTHELGVEKEIPGGSMPMPRK